MAYKDDIDEIECEIIEAYGIFAGSGGFWNKEVNLVSWNGRPAKLDIRNWQKDHEKCGKGITLTREEAESLLELLKKILKTKPEAGKKKTASSTAKPHKKDSANGKAGASYRKNSAFGKSGASYGKDSAFGKSGASYGKDSAFGKADASYRKAAEAKKPPKKAPPVPKNLEMFYKELKLPFGAGPDECKTARNALLKKFHPDIYTGKTAFATGKTIKIKEAYDKILKWWRDNGLV